MNVMLRRGSPSWPSAVAARDRCESPGSEDKAEIARRAVEVVLDDVRHENLDRPHEEQVGDGGAGERDPEPAPLADEAPAVAKVTDDRAGPDGFARDSRRTHQQQREGGDGKAHGVQGERCARAGRADENPADRRAEHAQGDRSDELVERVGLRELALGNQVGDDGVEGRGEEGLARAVDGDDECDMPDLERTRQAQHRKGGRRERPCDVGRQHQVAAVQAIAQRTADEQERDRRHGHRDADYAHRGGRVAQLVDLPPGRR
jgi:hypothetical protein